MGQSGSDIALACAAVKEVISFYQDCAEKTSESDLMCKAGKLLARFGSLLQDAPDGGDVAEALGVAQAALASSLNEAGSAWIKEQMQKVGDAAQVAAAGREIFQAPTPFLESCLVTSAMSKELCVEGTLELGSSLQDLAAAMPRYSKVMSISFEMMQNLCPDHIAKCGNFCKEVDAKLSEFADAFNASLVQQKKLAGKYMCQDGLCGL